MLPDVPHGHGQRLTKTLREGALLSLYYYLVSLSHHLTQSSFFCLSTALPLSRNIDFTCLTTSLQGPVPDLYLEIRSSFSTRKLGFIQEPWT